MRQSHYTALLGLTICLMVGLILFNGFGLKDNRNHQTSRLKHISEKTEGYRHKMYDRYTKLTTNEADCGVLAAMTLGEKKAVNKDLRRVYAVTGAAHVLALSGLHLSIIYMLLMRLTFNRQRSILVQTFILSFVWGYTLLTGLAISTVRSAIMLTIYSLLAIGGRRGHPLNVLALTALILVLMDRTVLYDIGFQLSFAAVLAIVLIMPIADELVGKKRLLRHPIIKWIWELVMVSVAAQIGVAPLLAFHFGTFSTYFLLTNFVAIPSVTVILYLALVFWMTPFDIVGQLMVGVVHILNKVLAFVAQIPYSVIDGLHPSVMQTFLVYVGFGCWYYAVHRFLQKPQNVI